MRLAGAMVGVLCVGMGCSKTVSVGQAGQPVPVERAAPEVLTAGNAVFTQNCAACHRADGSPGLGPDLFDDVWIHGGELEQITAVITNGVQSRGMPAWGEILGPDDVTAVAAYLHASARSKAP